MKKFFLVKIIDDTDYQIKQFNSLKQIYETNAVPQNIEFVKVQFANGFKIYSYYTHLVGDTRNYYNAIVCTNSPLRALEMAVTDIKKEL